MKSIVLFGFIAVSLLLEADSFRIKAHFPPKSAKRQSRLILSGTLPPLREVTVCHWVNAHSRNITNPKGMYIVSYAHGKAADELLTGVMVTNQSTKLVMAIRNTTSEVASTGLFQLGNWHHLCFIWSSGSGQSLAYLDGALVNRASTPHVAGQEIREGGILMIGQDQDIYNGKFDPDEAWDGFISDVHIWDEKLTNKQITDLANCGKLEGNVFAWMRSPLTAEDGVTLSGTNLCSD